MRISNFNSKAIVKAAILAVVILLLGASASFAQQVVNLTAGPAGITTPDGVGVPMWGYSCGTAAQAVTSSLSTTFVAATAGPPATPATATDPTGAMVVNAYIGYTVTAGGLTGIVQSNTATTLTLTSAGWTGGATPTNGTAFSIAASTANCVPLAKMVSAGMVGAVAVVNGGSGYTNATAVALSAPPTGGVQASAVANVQNGQVVSISLTSPGAGYTSAPTVTISDSGGTGATATAGLAWSPVVITVPSGQGLTINLTNNLSFTPAGGGTANNIPTSIVIVGQVGGGLGTQRTTSPSPDHTNAQGCVSWFIANIPPGAPCTGTAPIASPPAQKDRVQSMATEVAAFAAGTVGAAPTTLTWTALKPGTYLLESGTHPSIQVPMGLIGMVVVTCPINAAAGSCTAPGLTTPGTAYVTTSAIPGNSASPLTVSYGAEVPLEFSEIDPVQNAAVNAAVNTAGFSEYTVWDNHNSTGVVTLTLSNAGSGYTSAPNVTITGGGGSGAAAAANLTTGGAITISVTSGGMGYTSLPSVAIDAPPAGGTQAIATPSVVVVGGCGSAHTCYPPAVNYTPFYFLINGTPFNKTNVIASEFPTIPTTPTAGSNLLVRLVNAGLRMHVPSIVNSQTNGFTGGGVLTTAANPVNGFTLIAEDGNPLPNLAAPRVQTDVFMASGKTYDVMVNAPASGTAGADLAIFARDLGLSANSSGRDAGMLAYITANANISGIGLPAAPGSGVFAGAAANPDTYNAVVAGQTLTVSDPSKGVIANDVNVYGVTLVTPPGSGVVTLNANGTFTYTPGAAFSSATGDSFGYCANGTALPASPATSALCTTVTLGGSTLTGSGPTAVTQAYKAASSTYIKVSSPGLLLRNSDGNNLPISIVTTGPALAGLTLDASGGFTVVNPSPSTTADTIFAFQYTVQNSHGQRATGNATVTFPVGNGPAVTVLDAQQYSNCNGDSTCIAGLLGTGYQITDYRWIIEEDKTFWIDPNCTTNSSITTPGCPGVVSGPAGQTTVPTFGVNFHTSFMDYVAQGCTGTLSCEGGQTAVCGLSGGIACPTGTAPGTHISVVCDAGNGACRPDPTGSGSTPVLPTSVHLDPTKRYYISVLPGDGGNPFPGTTVAPSNCKQGPFNADGTLNTACGHTISGAPIAPACNILNTTTANTCTPTSTAFSFAPVTVLSLPTPLPTGKLSVIVFEDDFPLNGEQDAGGGLDVVSPNEPGLGGFNIVLWDTYGGLGDVTGQDSFDMFNMPLANSLAGTIDPATGLDACPLSAEVTANVLGTGNVDPVNNPQGAQAGVTSIVTCPKYESDNQTLSPLAGQAIIANLMPDKFSVQAYPGADRIARGEEWIQTNTLDGQHPHDSFIRIGEPGYFQEYGPAGYHVSIGFVNPKIVNNRHDAVCAGAYGSVGPCTNSVTGQVNVQRLSRTPDQRLYQSGSHDALAWTQCWVSLGDPDAEDFMFTKCDSNGNFTFANVPSGNWRLTIGDQWNDQIIDGLSTPANVGCATYSAGGNTGCTGGQTLALGNIGVQQWQSNLYTKTCVDDNRNGICDSNEIGIPLIYTRIRYRDGHNSNSLTTDFSGVANFNETFPLFNWYVVESDPTRYKTTGTHTVYDAGGPADGSGLCGAATRPCNSGAYNFLANTYEAVPLPADLSVPGAVYCVTADCVGDAGTYAAGTAVPSSTSNHSTGRIDPPWVWAEGWSGMTSQGNWIEFAKAPYASCPPACVTTPASATSTPKPSDTWGENGGIVGFVNYASTRPFDSAEQMIQQPWEPWVPHVTINLYQEGFAGDGVTPTLTMVDTTETSSWDDWAQGFYPNTATTGPANNTAGSGAAAGTKPYMSCPGQGTNTGTNADLFYFTLFDQPNYLDWYNSEHNGGTLHALPYNSQFKCYDAMHIWNQIQPAMYDGHYSFPSSLGIDAQTGKGLAVKGSTNGVASNMNGTNCTICVANPDTTDPYRFGTPMLPPGKYVVEVIMPPGYEVYKEEDKNLLIGDNFIAPVTLQFAGLGGDVFIIPDQASVASMYEPNNSGYNPTNYQNATTGLNLQGGMLSGVPGYPGFTDPVWPCVGEMRVVPDYLSLFPQVLETAPFAGAIRPLCDRKEVTLTNQIAVNAKFAVFTSTHIASKYTGVITDDFTSEFDPFAPQFGEKFAPPNLPISTKDYLGNELSRVYSDHWGIFDGLTFSSWAVNPPNITGYSPSMMVQCMNDPGPIPDPAHPGQFMNDPLYNPAYSNFCYEEPYMPGLTTYLDTPVVPTQAFVGAGYNNPDCGYPDATPAIAEVDGDGIGPYVSAFGNTITITALGNSTVANPNACVAGSTGADVSVNNYGYAGPSANVAPFDCKTVTRHYGFGAMQGTGTVTVGGVPLTGVSWNDTSITGTVVQSAVGPGGPVTMPLCTIQQQAEYAPGATPAYCGELVITAANGKQSIDTVTVTIGGKGPTYVNANQSIQAAIDAAAPGDLIIVTPTCSAGAAGLVPCTTNGTTTAGVAAKTTASHTEMLLMWKPVRLQGVGAATTIINANVHPAGKLLDPWRRHINCLFGLTLQGVPYTASTGANPYDPSSTYNCPESTWMHFKAQPDSPQIDRLPLEATVGWTATLNGNLAELLQEPSLMGAYEGAGITVLGKGLEFHNQSPWNDGSENGAFPTGTTNLLGVVANPAGDPGLPGALQVGDANPLCHTVSYDSTTGALILPPTSQTNPYPSNFACNPSSIDGLTITNSSQGGGGIFVHGWAHFLQIANNRVYNNAGTLSGGISVGQGEFAPQPSVGGTNTAPGSCSDGTGFLTNEAQPWCLQAHVNVHHNFITNNSSIGDELFSATLSGGGGISFCTGNDYYKFNFNWVCGNLSAGEGGGLVHLGEIFNGDIEHNSILFNQSSNPTIPTNGGGIMVQGTPDTDPVCGPSVPDTDCPPGLSDGTGPGLLINANLIQGNSADSGSGGGIRLSQVNGTEVSTFPGIYPITALDEGHRVTIRVRNVTPAIPLPSVGDTVTIAGVSVAGYNGTFTVTGVGTRLFNYIDPNAGLGAGAGGTFTDTTAAGTAQPILTATEAGPTVVTVTSTLSPTAGDTITIAGVTPGAYNGAHTVTCTPSSIVSAACPGGATAAGTFTFNSAGNLPTAVVTAASTVTDSNPNQATAALWHSVTITNNIITNNVAGWDGAGISLQDALNVQIINNTITHNDSLATSGVLTTSLGAPQASAPNTANCTNAAGTASCPQSAGITSTQNSTLLTTTFTGLTLSCPPRAPNCRAFSNPVLYDNILWQNRSFYVGVGGFGAGNVNQQKLVTLFEAFTNTAAPAQTITGECAPFPAGSYWDLGVRGDTGPGNHVGGLLLHPVNSVLTSTTGGYAGSGNTTADPAVTAEYCNGSRVPPECSVANGCGGPGGFGTPPGIADALAPNPVFSLTASATVDEGNNWVNVSWGPLSLTNPSATGGAYGNYGGGLPLSNATPLSYSPVIDAISCSGSTAGGCVVAAATAVLPALVAPTTDFFGNARPNEGDGLIDKGAVEHGGARTGRPAPTLTSITPNGGLRGTAVQVVLIGTDLEGATAVAVSGGGVTVSGITSTTTTVAATFTIASTATPGTRNVTVTTPGGTSNAVTFSVEPAISSVTPSGGVRGTVVNVTVNGLGLTGATGIAFATGTGITVSNFAFVNDTQVTATFTIASSAATGAGHTFHVNVGATTSNNLAFTVAGATVTISAPTPAMTSGGTSTKNATITVSNAGTATAPFTVTASPSVLKTAGPAASSFAVTGGTCAPNPFPAAGVVVAPGGNCTITVQYLPGGSTTTSTAHVSIPNSGAATNPLLGGNFNAN